MEFSEDETNILGEHHTYTASRFVPRNLLSAVAPVQTQELPKAKPRANIPKKQKPAHQPSTENGEGVNIIPQTPSPEPERAPVQELVRDEEGFFTCKIPFINHRMPFIIEENRKIFPNAKFAWAEPAQKPNAFEEEDIDFDALAALPESNIHQPVIVHASSEKITEEKNNAVISTLKEETNHVNTNIIKDADSGKEEDDVSTKKRVEPPNTQTTEKSPKRVRNKKVKTEEETPKRVSARLLAKQNQH